MSSAPPPLDPSTLLQVLARFLRTRGERVVQVGLDVGVRTERLDIIFAAVDFRGGHNFIDAVLQMVFVPVGESMEVEERLVGRGADAPDALDNALECWWRGAAQTTLAALSSKTPGTWAFGPRFLWELEGQTGLHSFLDRFDVSAELAALVRSDGEFRWSRFFVARLADGQVVADCYLDNMVFEAGREYLLATSWPGHQWSMRQFMGRGR